jgi:hypothetical protein
LDGPEFESLLGRYFLYLSRLALGATQPLIRWVLDIIPGAKAVRYGFNNPPLSRAEVKERIELNFYFPSGFFMSSSGRNLPKMIKNKNTFCPNFFFVVSHMLNYQQYALATDRI